MRHLAAASAGLGIIVFIVWVGFMAGFSYAGNGSKSFIREAAYNDTYVGTQTITICFPAVATRSPIKAGMYTVSIEQLLISKRGRFPLISRTCAVVPMAMLMESNGK